MTNVSAPAANAHGLYLHIPFCHRVCHYCDFTKTARYDAATVAAYLAQLTAHCAARLDFDERPVTSVFLGGGTPGMFAEEYAALFATISRHTSAGCEITIEANPNDITTERLKIWRDLGVNRLSVGVQTFAEDGLRFLTREHSAAVSRQALAAAMQVFANVNADLIYGWRGQTIASWEADLRTAVGSGVPHLSLYNLTYEPSTVIGRRVTRGIAAPTADDELLAYYQLACAELGTAGYQHEEISNWSRPGFSCQHNWLYWSGATYAGVGSGAHGFLPGPAAIGVRYSYPKPLRSFLLLPPVTAVDDDCGLGIDRRDSDAWLLEFIVSFLRTTGGTDLQRATVVSGKEFRPNGILQRGLDEGVVTIAEGRLLLSEAAWFVENAWSLQAFLSFVG